MGIKLHKWGKHRYAISRNKQASVVAFKNVDWTLLVPPPWQMCENCNTIITQVNILLVLPHYNRTSAFLLSSVLNKWLTSLLAASCWPAPVSLLPPELPHIAPAECLMCTIVVEWLQLYWWQLLMPNYMCSNSKGEQCTLYGAGEVSTVRNPHHRHCKTCELESFL